MPIVNNPTFPHKRTGKEVQIGIRARGTIAQIRTYQETTVTVDGDMRHRRRVQQQKPYHIPEYNPTPAQLACEAKMRAAVAAWKLLDDAGKAPWRALAAANYRTRGKNPASFKAKSAMNIFISKHIKP
jgi:hypothetical protein